MSTSFFISKSKLDKFFSINKLKLQHDNIFRFTIFKRNII